MCRYGLLIRKGEGGQSRLSSLDNKSMSVGWTVAIILLLFALICTFLVLLYFFYNVMGEPSWSSAHSLPLLVM